MFLKINENDNCAVALRPISKGEAFSGVTANCDIPRGHKIALSDIKKSEKIIKYGYPIGVAKCDICKGDWLHTHNIETRLSGLEDFAFSEDNEYTITEEPIYFNGYRRSDGRVGIRNELLIIPTVGCVNKTVEAITCKVKELYKDNGITVACYTHPYGCSQLGDDLENTKKALAGLIMNGNIGAALVVSLGCENNDAESFRKTLGDFDEKRVRFLVMQKCSDEIAEAVKIAGELVEILKADKREQIPLSFLTVGMKCGGSDAFSGITANPLCGKIADRLTSLGGKVILTEVPEMFGAEQILTGRALNKDVFDKTVDLINSFRQYYISNSLPIGENPSPGNREGGITTLEEKSLGCVAKGGKAVVTDVLSYGERCKKSGLSLLKAPGNDQVSSTALVCSGANIILFTTGRGTPFGAAVPTVKISSNTALYENKSNWIDFDAGRLISDGDFEISSDELISLILDIANGKQTKNENNGYKDIAIFKTSVTL